MASSAYRRVRVGTVCVCPQEQAKVFPRSSFRFVMVVPFRWYNPFGGSSASHGPAIEPIPEQTGLPQDRNRLQDFPYRKEYTSKPVHTRPRKKFALLCPFRWIGRRKTANAGYMDFYIRYFRKLEVVVCPKKMFGIIV